MANTRLQHLNVNLRRSHKNKTVESKRCPYFEFDSSNHTFKRSIKVDYINQIYLGTFI